MNNFGRKRSYLFFPQIPKLLSPESSSKQQAKSRFVAWCRNTKVRKVVLAMIPVVELQGGVQ